MKNEISYIITIHLTQQQIVEQKYDLCDKINSELRNNPELIGKMITEFKKIVAIASIINWDVMETFWRNATFFAQKYLSIHKNEIRFNHEKSLNFTIALEIPIVVRGNEILKDYLMEINNFEKRKSRMTKE